MERRRTLASAENAGAQARRFVHLGDRLLALDQVRRGDATVEEAARAFGVEPREVVRWIERHRAERTLTFEELREQCSPERSRLARRAQRLAGLVAQAERLLRELHQEFISRQGGEYRQPSSTASFRAGQFPALETST